jgi:glycosidase
MKKFGLPFILTVIFLSGSCRNQKAERDAVPSADGPTIRDAYVVSRWDGTNLARLRWTSASGEGISYRISLREGFYDPNRAGDIGSPVCDWTEGISRFTVSNLVPGKTYIATVEARDEEGVSRYLPREIDTLSTAYEECIPYSNTGSSLPDGWWKRAVFYEVFVRSFYDSDGDGKGDLKGLTEKLDYLKSLGVGGLWLMPIAESADHDHGYNVVNYRKVEPDYGSTEDFRRLMEEAHKRGIGIIVDYVVNHTSDHHPFFLDASTNRNSPYRSWYCFEPVYPGQWTVPEGSLDPWTKCASGWYYGFLVPTIPDLNWMNQDVRAWMNDNLRFWLNLGVDGYRYDAVMNLVENGPKKLVNQPETHAVFSQQRELIDHYSNRYTVCENGNPAYFGNGKNEFHSAFAFGFNRTLIDAINNGFPGSIDDQCVRYLGIAPAGTRYATFLGNHDFPFGARVATQVGENLAKEKLAAALLLTLPGIPYLYYGEEIGMTSQNLKYGDGSLRTPMQWSSATNAGFSTGKPYRKVNTNYPSVNVEMESADPASLLNYYRKIIAVRNTSPALSTGEYLSVRCRDPRIFAYLRYTDSETVLVTVNFAATPKDPIVEIGKSFHEATDLLEPDIGAIVVKDGDMQITGLPPMSVRIHLLK